MSVPSPLLVSLGWDDARAAEFVPYGREGYCAARIARVDRSGYDLLGGDGPVRATACGAVLDARAKDSSAAPCVGDWVGLRRWADDRTTIEAVLPRRTAVVRAAVRGSRGQVLVANHDVAMLVEPLFPEPDLGRIERLLALAWQSGAAPVVVLTKSDRVPDASDLRDDVALVATGVDVHVVSATTGAGMEVIAGMVRSGRTIALLGPSGAGKSTLTNALAGSTLMITRELRGDGKGRHTTAHRELFVLPGGGVVIDTPGLRVVGLFDAEEGLGHVFADVESLAADCRFTDCEHRSEPDCAVLAAVDAGDLPLRRMESWRKLQREMHRMALRQDARLRQAELAKWKQLTREHRADKDSRGSRRR